MLVTKEDQAAASYTSSAVRLAVKALVVIVSGLSGLFILKMISVLRKKNNKTITPEQATEQISQIKADWYKRVSQSATDGWSRGSDIGLKAVRKQGVKPTGDASANQDILNSILSDVKRTIEDAEALIVESMNSGSEDHSKLIKAISLRQQMSVEASLKYAVAITMESELASPDTMKMWVATSKEPCSHCRRLNGLVREWGEEFPHSFLGVSKLRVYGGVLLGPLRHPNCLCVLIRVPKVDGSNA